MKSTYLIEKSKQLWLQNHSALSLQQIGECGAIRSNILNAIKYRFELDCSLLLFASCCSDHWLQLQSLNPNTKTIFHNTDIAIRWDGLRFTGSGLETHCIVRCEGQTRHTVHIVHIALDQRLS
eukprot:160033_1